MSRVPNPWVVVPTAIAAIGGAVVGFFVTEASCEPTSCTVTASLVATISGLGAAIGVGVVVVLALKSLSEWRDHADREILTTVESDEPSPPTC